MKTKHKIIIGIIVLGLISAYLVNVGHKKLLKMAIEPIEAEIGELKTKNDLLVRQMDKDSLNALILVQEKKDLIENYTKQIDSILKIKKIDEKAIINYGGDFNSRFRIFTEHLTTSN